MSEVQSWPALRQPVSALTHLLYLPILLYAIALLWRLCRGDRQRQWSIACFGLSACLLYAVSGCYHAFHGSPSQLESLRQLDLSAIFLLIAGTCTPLFVVYLQGSLRRVTLIVTWSIALAGIAGKWLIPGQSYVLTVGLYFGMALISFLPLVSVARNLGWRGLRLFLLGALFYAGGGICDVLKRPILIPGVFHSHELLHVMDLAGTTTHVIFLFRYVVPRQKFGGESSRLTNDH